MGLRGPEPELTDRKAIRRALVQARWVMTHAARALGVSKQTLYATIRRLGIRRRPPTKAYYVEKMTHAAQAPRPNRRTRVA